MLWCTATTAALLAMGAMGYVADGTAAGTTTVHKCTSSVLRWMAVLMATSTMTRLCGVSSHAT
jgi:hypothetical protein